MEEMAVYDPNEDDREGRWNPIAALVLIGIPLSIPLWMAIIAGVRRGVPAARCRRGVPAR